MFSILINATASFLFGHAVFCEKQIGDYKRNLMTTYQGSVTMIQHR